MEEKTIKDLGRIYIDKDGAIRLYIGKSLAKKAHYKHGDRVKITYNPIEKKLIIEDLEL